MSKKAKTIERPLPERIAKARREGRTMQAFAHYEAGRDEEARNALQAIGLQSPFLEWKVFLRGLLAYSAQDNARALENWQRLDSARLPGRLSSALRASIDPTFLAAQP